MTDCIRGCTRPCRCDNCLLLDPGERDPLPVPAVGDGLLCKRCSDKLHEWLSTVLDDTARLLTRIPDDYSLEKPSTHRKVTGSPALARLDIVALTDSRSAFGVANDPDRPDHQQPRNYEENQQQNPPIDIPGELITWAQTLADEHQLTTPITNMAAAVNLLQAWWETLTASTWIAEFYDRMRDIHRLLDSAHGVERRRPVGHCLSIIEKNGQTVECGQALFQDPNSPGIAIARCSGCGRIYRGLDLIRAQVVEHAPKVG